VSKRKKGVRPRSWSRELNIGLVSSEEGEESIAVQEGGRINKRKYVLTYYWNPIGAGTQAYSLDLMESDDFDKLVHIGESLPLKALHKFDETHNAIDLDSRSAKRQILRLQAERKLPKSMRYV
jgi:hypothetical protein